MRKIKRYNRIYTQRRSRSVLRVLGFLVLCAALVFVGFSLFGPVQDFIEGLRNPSSPSSDVSSLTDSSSQPGTASSTPDSSAPGTEDTAMRGAYLPASALSDDDAFDRFIAFAKAQNVNTAVLEMKSSDGVVHYNSALENVIKAGAVADSSFDIGKRLAALKENGLDAVALIHVFQDRLAARVFYESAVKYGNTGTNWLDNSLDLGGKPWLNPYSDFSSTYNLDIASELMDLGFSGVMADSVQFPSGYALNYATYGENQSSKTRQQCLADFAARFTELAGSKDKTAILAASVTASLSPEEQVYGTDGPLLYGCSMIAPRIVPASFGTRLTAGGLTVEAPAKTPAQTVSAVTAAVMQKNAGARYIPFIQCYTDSTLAAEVNKTYTLEDVAAEVAALEGQGVEDYILFDPSGAYQIS